MNDLEQYFENSKSAMQLMNLGIAIYDESGNKKPPNDIINELAEIFLQFKENEDEMYKEFLKDYSLETLKRYKEINQMNKIIINTVIYSVIGIRNANKLSSIITDRMNEIINIRRNANEH